MQRTITTRPRSSVQCKAGVQPTAEFLRKLGIAAEGSHIRMMPAMRQDAPDRAIVLAR